MDSRPKKAYTGKKTMFEDDAGRKFDVKYIGGGRYAIMYREKNKTGWMIYPGKPRFNSKNEGQMYLNKMSVYKDWELA